VDSSQVIIDRATIAREVSVSSRWGPMMRRKADQKPERKGHQGRPFGSMKRKREAAVRGVAEAVVRLDAAVDATANRRVFFSLR